MKANEPLENAKRLEVLQSFDVLDTGAEKVYDDLTRLTADICEVPVCLVSLVEQDRQWFKSETGLGICETKIEQSICAYAVTEDNYLEIPDTQLDLRTQDNTLCGGDNPFRFYAGALLRTLDGWSIGTLCVLDYKPRKLTSLQRRTLEVHATSVTRQLELTRALVNIAKDGGTHLGGFLVGQAREDLTKKTRVRYETLTPREKEIMNVIAGLSGSSSSKQLAQMLQISPRTVDHHRASILSKMDVASVAELVAVSLKTGILHQNK